MVLTRFSKTLPNDYPSGFITKDLIKEGDVFVSWGDDEKWIGCVISPDKEQVKRILREAGASDQQIVAIIES